jgi:hypothetical protein
MLQRQLRVRPRGLSSRREILLYAGNKAFERLGKIPQEGEYRRALQAQPCRSSGGRELTAMIYLVMKLVRKLQRRVPN